MALSIGLVRQLATIGLATTVFVACAAPTVLDGAKVQQQIVGEFQQEAGVTVSVTCPGDQPIQQGNVFVCTAVAVDGTNLVITVTQTDNAGNVNWQITGAE